MVLVGQEYLAYHMAVPQRGFLDTSLVPIYGLSVHTTIELLSKHVTSTSFSQIKILKTLLLHVLSFLP
jgi:uncharacterized membrane protein